ncbi:MAG: UDP-N-acetylmuramoyl-L-alanyl-D-glutamate--2,6-diaminopimelate ligase [Alphaproteobacteria bacterium]|nr:MAG: UDP-N-acetylmuramoyl-L-alanyl-D-glutamate--2,6-diaminopimelate ligase [Alphaproteobacteria bacterium]
MRLSDLTGSNGGAAKVEIRGISADSRMVKPGYLFAALAGTKQAGADFIDDAISHGAVAILTQAGLELDHGKAFMVADQNPRRRLALMAAKFYQQQPEKIVAVTGTNGKSSVVDFTRQIWENIGNKAASLGTLGIKASDFETRPSLTTPDPVEIHAALRDLAEQKINHLAMEASSHGLEQYRLDGVHLSAAAFTNLSRDHLDYHGSLEDYFHAKLRLFGDLLPPGSTAVINRQSDYYDRIADLCWARGIHILSVGDGGDLTWRVSDQGPSHQDLDIGYGHEHWTIRLNLIGDFQASNALIAAALVIASGGDANLAIKALADLKAVQGRMDFAGQHHNGATIYVDYAHTPDALETVLQALRPHAKGALSVVFGCGGDRDQGKRPLMGKIANKLADRVIVTDDNPRGEEAKEIRASIMKTCPKASEIGDRKAAIRQAIEDLQSGDLLVIAGKGHETGQIIGDETFPFDDAEEVAAVLAEIGGSHD